MEYYFEQDRKDQDRDGLLEEKQRYGRKIAGSRLRFGWTYHYPLINGILIFLSLLLVAGLVYVISYAVRLQDQKTEELQKKSEEVVQSAPIGAVRVEAPLLTEDQILVGTGVLAYMESDLDEEVASVLAPYRQDGTRMDAGYPVTLDFDVTGLPVGTEVEKIVVEVDETRHFLAPRTMELEADARSVSIPHLKTGTKYYYRITLILAGDLEVGAQGSFHTADTPRLLSIDGIVNVRDIGGVSTLDGRTIRQGVLYRGSELDGKTEFTITPQGVEDMVQILGIRTELDLRYVEVPTNTLGPDVRHISYGTAMYADVLQMEYNEKMRCLFSDLAKPEIYPAYLHCSYGWDRTGTFCCILQAFLGVSEEDIIREHELSALYYGGANTEELEELLDQLKAMPGENLQEKVSGYMRNIGVTNVEMESIRNILLTPAVTEEG